MKPWPNKQREPFAHQVARKDTFPLGAAISANFARLSSMIAPLPMMKWQPSAAMGAPDILWPSGCPKPFQYHVHGWWDIMVAQVEETFRRFATAGPSSLELFPYCCPGASRDGDHGTQGPTVHSTQCAQIFGNGTLLWPKWKKQ